MKADSLKISKVFSTGGDVHYILPHFQREYAWEKTNWQTLINDIFSIYEIYNDKEPPEHFLGALVVINDGTRNGTVPVFRLVDGQQRLTTISLFLCALGRLVERSHPVLYKKIRRLLVNEDERGELYFKLLPTIKYGDRQSYLAILKREALPENVESKIPEAFTYLAKELEARFQQGKFDPEQLFVVLANCLQVVFIDLDQRERPYEIFESLNYKGKSLSQADLVRNYIAMKLPESHQARVFENYWSPIESMLQERRTVGRSRLGELTAFLRHYLAYLSGNLCNEEHVYSRFRDRGQQMSADSFVQEIAILNRFAGYYDRLLRPESEPNLKVRRLLRRLNTLEIATAYPFLLYVYELQDREQISQDDFVDGLKILETYIVRRYLAKESTNYLNKMFPTLSREVDINKFSESLRKALAAKNFPSDSRLRQAAVTVKVYDRSSQTRQKLGLIFDTINRHLSSGSGAYTALDGDPTIEHIMPQTLNDEWKKQLGTRWMEEHELLHTLGNLTLVTQEWNSSLSNALYEVKRSKLAGHGLLLNQLYFNGGPLEWNGDAIKARAHFLVEKLEQIWPVLGNSSELSSVKERPKSLTILGQTFTVKSWRDVAEQTAEVVAQICDDFNQIAASLPNYLSHEPFQLACRQLSNGWWLYVNLSADAVKRLCQSLIEEAGIPEDEFELELW
jgi:uncharacterized protein with ParB-like and HNH nuclease domain